MGREAFLNTKLKDIDTALFFKEFMDNSQAAGILVMDVDGIVHASNATLSRILGYSKEDLRGQYFGKLFIPEDKLKNLPEIELKNVLQKGAHVDQNYLYHKRGTYIWVYGESISVQDKEGDMYIVKTIFDTNDKKLLEEQLTYSNQKLMNANKDLETFVFTVSHDLKAPINNIGNLLAALEEELSDEGRKMLEETNIMPLLHTSVSRFKDTLRDLASMAKAPSGIAEEIRSQVPFKEVLEEVKADLRGEIESLRAVVSDFFAEAPAVFISKKNLRSILHNFLSNALKFTRPGLPPQIKFKTTKVNADTVLLEVEDNGIGISEEDQERVFSMYERAHTHVEGTGVGLSIVKRIVENNGGEIAIESQIGRGTRFKIYFHP